MNGRAPSSGWMRCSTFRSIRSASSKSSSTPTATWRSDKSPPSISRTSSPRIGLPITTLKSPFHRTISFSSGITSSSFFLSFLLSSGTVFYTMLRLLLFSLPATILLLILFHRRVQLGECLKTVIHSDYPEQFPHLLDWIKQNLQDQQQVHAALFVLRILSRKYE